MVALPWQVLYAHCSALNLLLLCFSVSLSLLLSFFVNGAQRPLCTPTPSNSTLSVVDVTGSDMAVTKPLQRWIRWKDKVRATPPKVFTFKYGKPCHAIPAMPAGPCLSLAWRGTASERMYAWTAQIHSNTPLFLKTVLANGAKAHVNPTVLCRRQPEFHKIV